MSNLAHEAVGPVDAPCLLFLHGWTSDRSIFARQWPAFAEQWRCLLVDLPGHGASPPMAGDCSVTAYAEAIAGFIADMRAEAAVPVGHSLGALIALELLARPGARHPAAVLIDPAPIVKTERMQASLERTDAMIAERGRLAAQGELARRAFFLETDPEEVRADVVATAKATPDAVAVPTWKGIVGYDGREALDRTRVPLLFVNAAQPENREADIRAHAAGPVHWGRTIGAGHFNLRIVPGQVNAMIADFLALPGTASLRSNRSDHVPSLSHASSLRRRNQSRAAPPSRCSTRR